MGSFINKVTGVNRGRTARARKFNLARNFVKRNPKRGYYVTESGDVGRSGHGS